MKKKLTGNFQTFLSLLLIFCAFGNIHAQQERKNYMGGNFSLGKSFYTKSTFNNKYEATSYRDIGFRYAHLSSQNIEVCLGLFATVVYLEHASIFIPAGVTNGASALKPQ